MMRQPVRARFMPVHRICGRVVARRVVVGLSAVGLLLGGCVKRREEISVQRFGAEPELRCENVRARDVRRTGKVTCMERMQGPESELSEECYRLEWRGSTWRFDADLDWLRVRRRVCAEFDVGGALLALRVHHLPPGGELGRDKEGLEQLVVVRGDDTLYRERTPGEKTRFFRLKGPAPHAVTGLGHGIVSMWLKRAALDISGQKRDTVIDMTKIPELEPALLIRDKDRAMPDLGTVRVYRYFGRDTVFADADDTVIGDLSGLRRASLVPKR